MTSMSPDRMFNPDGAIRVAQLRQAREWAAAGRPYAALSLYSHLLARYPGSGVAEAAVEELVDLAAQLQEQGHAYAALKIFRKVEELQ